MTKSNPNATSRIINIIQTSKKRENYEIRIFISCVGWVESVGWVGLSTQRFI